MKKSILVKMRKIILLICLCRMANILVSGSLQGVSIGDDIQEEQPQFVHCESLNFEIRNTNIEEGNYVRSGPKGTLQVWDKSFVDLQQRKSVLFDVNAIHEVLCKKAGDNIQGGNRVTAALTFVFQVINESDVNSAYYAVTSLLTKPNPSQKKQETGVPPRRSVRIFVAGTRIATNVAGTRIATNNVDEHGTYVISDLYKSCLFRNKHINLNEEVRKVVDTVEKIQHLKFAFIPSMLGERTNILEIQDKLNHFDNILTSHWQRFVDGLKEGNELYDYYNELKTIDGSKNFKLVVNALRLNAGYGPVVDSEQHFLEYLRNNLIQIREGFSRNIKGIYLDLREAMTEEQYHYLNSHFSERVNFRNAPEVNEKLFSRGLELSKNVVQFLPLGCIIHMHSTNECCDYCATSLFYEFYVSRENSINDLRDFMKSEQDEISEVDAKAWRAPCDPFVNIVVSYSKDLDAEKEHVLRTKGAFKPLSHEEQNRLINLDQAIIPFKKIMNEGSLSAHTDSDGYIIPSTL